MNIKHYKFKISEPSGKIFKKEHGYNVDKKRSQSSSTSNIPTVVNELSNYYEDITSKDRILATGNKDYIISKQTKLGISWR